MTERGLSEITVNYFIYCFGCERYVNQNGGTSGHPLRSSILSQSEFYIPSNQTVTVMAAHRQGSIYPHPWTSILPANYPI